MKVFLHPDSNHWVVYIYLYHLWGKEPYNVNPIIPLGPLITIGYLPVNLCICKPCLYMIRHQCVHHAVAHKVRMEDVVIVMLWALYCNVFSPVNETSLIVSLVGLWYIIWNAFMCFGGGVALESDLRGGWDLMLSKLPCYC